MAYRTLYEDGENQFSSNEYSEIMHQLNSGNFTVTNVKTLGNVPDEQAAIQSKIDDDKLADIVDKDAFWNQVAANLKSKRIKMIFAADQIPQTLERLIRFVDEQMPGIDCYGVEIARYQAGDATLLSRTVFETICESEQQVQARQTKEWTESSLLERIREISGAEATAAVKRILECCKENGMEFKLGNGKTYGNLAVICNSLTLFLVQTVKKKAILDFCYPVMEEASKKRQTGMQ